MALSFPGLITSRVIYSKKTPDIPIISRVKVSKKEKRMKKIVFLLATATLFSHQAFAEKVICKKRLLMDLYESYTLVVIEKGNSSIASSNESFCIANGHYYGAATPEEIKQFEEKNQLSLDIRNFSDVNNSFFMQRSSTNLDNWFSLGVYVYRIYTQD